jgi:hypothetical protein
MSAVQALGAARAFGVHLEADGDDLKLTPEETSALEAFVAILSKQDRKR